MRLSPERQRREEVRRPGGHACVPAGRVGCLQPGSGKGESCLEAAWSGLETYPGVSPGGKGDEMAKYEAYCVKCRAKREFEGEETTLKNGRRAAQGKCPVCGTKVMRILGKAS
jgi:hypothetical protein